MKDYLNQPVLHQLGFLLAEKSQNVVFVIGAGLSKTAGLPLWWELLDGLKNEAKFFIDRRDNVSQQEKENKKNKLDEIKDPWILGDQLEKNIPQEAYDRFIRSKLNTSSIPENYKKIWELSPSGVVSFNLDGIAEKCLDGNKDQVATAVDKGVYERFLLLSRPFLFQPHGNLRKKSSWVLSSEARNRLLKNESYKRFFQSLLSSRRLVLVGFGPKDISFQLLLFEDFRGFFDNGINHFWICPEPDYETELWAESFGIKIIKYIPSNERHEEVGEILESLKKYKPRDPETNVVYQGPELEKEELPDDDTLRTENVELIRQKLNAVLAGIASKEKDHDKKYANLREFFDQYSASLHMAWHIKENSSYATIWGAKVTEKVGGGAFGGVWKAEDPIDGQQIAVKVLHREVLVEKDFLEAFHRGVQAMKLLSKFNVKGMVKFIRAFDVPACVFMEYIDGVTLEDVVVQRSLDLCESVNIVKRVAEIVLGGHNIDKEILHRDLKPSNVMLKNYYLPDEETDVVVLDFDLSWYEGALGKSMVSSTLHNYIAPEQLQRSEKKYSSRRAAVDVFGIGMLLYYVITRNEPALGFHNDKDFKNKILLNFREAKWDCKFFSVPLYLSMVIEDATYEAQECRASMPVTIERLNVVVKTLSTGKVGCGSDLGNLEIASRLMRDRWDGEFDINGLNEIELRNGQAILVIYFDPEDGLFNLKINYAAGSDAPRAKTELKRYLKNRTESSAAILREGGLFKSDFSLGDGVSQVVAQINDKDWDFKKVEAISKAISSAAGKLTFS